MRLPLVCLIGFLFTFTSSESPRSYVADTRRDASIRPFNLSSPWRPQTRRYSRPHIQRVWLARDQNTTAKFRTNHTENIRSFAYAINDTSKFLRYLSEEESKLNLDKVIKYDKSSNSTHKQSSETEADDSDYETLETSDGYDSAFEDSQSMSDSSEITTKIPSTTIVSRGRYRPVAIQLFNRLPQVPTTTKAPNISTYSPKRRYRTTTVKPYQTTPFDTTTPFTVTPMIFILNVTEKSVKHSNNLHFPTERRAANTTVGEEERNGNSYSQQVIHITPYSIERQQYNSINYRGLDKTGVNLTTEHSNFHSKMFPTYEQHPDYNDNSYIITANRYQARTEKAEQVSQSLSDYRQTNANYTTHFHNRHFEPYDSVSGRYTSYSSEDRGNNAVYNTTHTSPTPPSPFQQYLQPHGGSYSNPYNIATSTENSHGVFRNHVTHSPTPAKQIDDTYSEVNNYISYSTTTLKPAFWVHNENTSSFHGSNLRYNSSQQYQMLPDTHGPTSPSPDYNSSSVSRQEHSVQIISMNDSSEYYQRDPVISYIEEPYTAYDRPSFFSRGISGTVPPTASDTKPLPSTVFPYPVEFIEAPYYSRRHNQRAYSRRNSKTLRRRHRKHRKRGSQRRIGASSAFNGVISPSINFLPPFLPTVDNVYSYGNNRIQNQPVMSIMEGRRWKDYPLTSSTQPSLHRRVDSRHEHSKKRGSKVARTFDGHSSPRRHPVLESGINMTAADYGELQLSPAESTYYKRRQVSMKQFLMKDVVEHQGSIPGVPGRDYPTYYMPPVTNFSCLNLQGRRGYFADPSTRCQVFYICPGDGRGEPMLCPNGTMFNQLVLVCDWWFNVDCGTS